MCARLGAYESRGLFVGTSSGAHASCVYPSLSLSLIHTHTHTHTTNSHTQQSCTTITPLTHTVYDNEGDHMTSAQALQQLVAQLLEEGPRPLVV